jgi:hypothetical protein
VRGGGFVYPGSIVAQGQAERQAEEFLESAPGSPPSELRRQVMSACLKLSTDACSLFDAVEAEAITIAVARHMIGMARTVDQIALGIRTIVLTEDHARPRPAG